MVEGYNVCLFAYEQSGSGKTYHDQGKDSKGVIQRVLLKCGLYVKHLIKIYVALMQWLLFEGLEEQAVL